MPTGDAPSFVIHARGDWPSGRILVEWVPSGLRISTAVTAIIESSWTTALARPGVHLFDGPLCRLESWRVDARGLHLALSRTSYKVFLGTNGSHPGLAASHGAEVMANAVGTSAAVLTSDGWLLFGERGPNVALYPNCAHPFGGCLEPAPELDVVEDMARELREELGLGSGDLADLRCLALGGDLTLGQPELTFLAVAKLTRAELERRVDAEEHRGTWAMRADADAIARALREERAMTPLTRLTLLAYGGHAHGSAWLAAAAPGSHIPRGSL